MRYTRLIFFFWCIPCLCWGQDRSDSAQSLEEVLKQLTDTYDVRFSYLDEVIEGKQVQLDSTDSSDLDAILIYLERTARLRFEKVDDDYITIRPFAVADKVPLCGIISDYSGAPIIGATVGYSRTEGGYTNENGYFQLDSVPYGARLTISSVGHITKQFNVSDLSFATCNRIRLGESVNMLDEVIISDYLAVGITKVENKIQINPSEFKTLPGLIEPDILQGIQQLPGVNSPYETAAGLYVRGGLPDQNLVMWNGIKTYNQGHFFGMISAFNPYVIDKVSFTKSGTSAQFGDRVSSVIDINTAGKVGDRISGGAGTNMLFGDAYLTLPIIRDKVSLQLSGRRSFTDVWETITYKKMADRVFQNTKINETLSDDQQASNSFFFNDFTSNVTWQVNSDNQLTINTLYNKNELNFQSQDIVTNQSFNDLLLNANEGYSLRWSNDSDGKFSFDADANFARYILRYQFLSSVADTVTESSKKNLVEEWGARMNTQLRLNEATTFRAGYHFSNNQIRYAYETAAPSYQLVLDEDNTTVQTHSSYGELEHAAKGWLLRPGIRVNRYQELSKTYLEPRLFVEKALNEQLSVNLSGEYRTQIASQIKESVVSDLSLENKVWALASVDRFPVIRSYQFTLGSNYRTNGWLFDVEGYRKQVMDVTTLIFGFLNPVDNSFRIGDSQIIGTDVFLKKQWLDYEAWTSYSYVRTENTFSGLNNDQSFPGSWNIEHTFRIAGIATLDDWQFSLGWIWHTGKAFTDLVDESVSGGPVSVSFGDINANNLPVYHRLDLSVMKEFQSQKFEHLRYRVGLSVLNVYNRRNLLNREFRTTPSLQNELIDTRVYSLGFTPNLVLRVFW